MREHKWDDAVHLEDEEDASHLSANDPDQFHRLAMKRQTLQRTLNKTKDALEEVDEMLLSFFPKEVGKFVRDTDDCQVMVNRKERWSWDTEKLREVYSGSTYPEFISETIKVDKRKFQKLSDEEKDKVLDALTRRPIKAEVEVREAQSTE